MEKRMLVVQALDERDLLIKKIMDKTESARFLDYTRQGSELTCQSRIPKEAFAREAQGDLQQILDWMAYYESIHAAVTRANAETWVETAKGRMTVAGAISLRNRLRGSGPYGELTDFEGRLVKKIQREYREAIALVTRQNKTGSSCERPLELYDPLHIYRRSQKIRERRDSLLAELETIIKISNATTWITI